VVTIVLTARTAPPRGRWQAAVGLAAIGALLLAFGAGPFLAGLRSIDPVLVPAALALAAGSTLCAAYRWRLVAVGMGVPMSLARAVRAYYASQVLNATLPGGLLGDVHRGLTHGRGEYPVGIGLRSVAWERLFGQAVQVALTGAALLLVPSPLRPPGTMGSAIGASLAAVVLLAAVLRGRGRQRRRPPAGRLSSVLAGRPAHAPAGRPARAPLRVIRILTADRRAIASSPRALPRIVLASVGAVGGHVTLFVFCARSVDPALPITAIIPLALLVLTIGALPLSLVGWGPREGAAAWAFGMAGLGAGHGISVSVAYGVLGLVGVLPGALVLLADHWTSHG